MRAIVISRFGGPDVLEVRDMPIPQPGPGQVAIDVAFAGVNYAEVLYRRGDVDVSLPFVPGIEVSGSIRALGVSEAYRRIERGTTTGKLVLRVRGWERAVA